jgi:hypothetical protein
MADVNTIISQDALKGLTRAIDDIAKINLGLDAMLKKANAVGGGKGLTTNTEKIKANKQAVSESAKVQKQYQASIKKLEVVNGAYNKALIKNTTELAKQKQAIKTNQKAVDSAKGSYDQLSASLAKDTRQWRALSAEQRKNSAEGKRLVKSINTTQKSLKRLDTQTGINTRRVGSYKAALSGVVKVLGAFGAALGLRELVNFGKTLLKIATSLEQVEKRARIVFGTSFPQIEKAAERLAKKMGVTTSQFINAAAATGDLLIPLDFTRKQAADMSLELQSLAGAMDEWTGGTIGVTEVSEILTKAMLGENEQLKRLGIAIRQDSEEFRNLVKQKQADENITKAQAMALATLELIQKKSADAQTAYAKSGTDLLRIQKSINLTWQRFKEHMAVALSPAKSATDIFKEQTTTVIGLKNNLVPLIDEYEELSKKGKLSADEQLRLKNLIVKIGKEVPTAITQVDEYGRVMGVSAGKAREFVKAQQDLLKIQNADAIEEQKERLEELRESFNRIAADVDAGFKTVTETTIKTIDGVTMGIEGQSKIVTYSAEEIAKFREKMAVLGAEMLSTENVIKLLSGDIDDWTSGVDVASGGTTVLSGTIGQLKKDLKVLQEQRDKINTSDTKALEINLGLIKALEERIKLIQKTGERPEVPTRLGGPKAPDQIELAQDTADQLKEIDDETTDHIIANKGKLDEADLDQMANRLQLAQEFGNLAFDAYQVGLDNQMAALQRQKDFELSLAEGNADKQAKIDEKFAKKRAALMRKKAIADKLTAIFNIALNTAVSIMAQGGVPVLGFGLVAAMAIIGAIQAGIVATTPIPQFGEGIESSPQGFAWLGDAGQKELIFDPSGGVSLSGDKPEMRYLKRGTKVISGGETERLLAAAKGYDSVEVMQLAGVIERSDDRIINAIQNKRELTIIPGKSKIIDRKGRYFKTYVNAKFES